MKVTILVPLYGVEKYIGECAESLFSQTYRDVEYVFLDDCTPDNSVAALQAVIDRHPDRQPHIRILHNEQNMGIGGVRERLVSEVRTDAFMFVDSDDVITLYAVELMVKAMERDDADIVEAAYCEFAHGMKGKVTTPFCGSLESYRSRLLCQNVLQNHVWGQLFSSRLIPALPDFFMRGVDYAEDVCGILRLMASVKKRSTISEVVYLYRTDNVTSYTNTMSMNHLVSVLRSNSIVWKYYTERAEVSLPLEIGMLNVYRILQRNHALTNPMLGLFAYHPQRLITRILAYGLRSSMLHSVADLAYRITRKACLK